MPDEPTVSKEQLAMMDDLDYVPELDEGTNPPEGDVAKPEGEVKEPEVKEPEVKEPEPAAKEPEGEKKEPVKETPDEERLRLYKEQVAHFQRLYEDERKAKEELAKPKEAPKEEGQKILTQEQIRTHYAPELRKTIEAGYMTEEFANSYPDEAVQFLYHRDIIYNLVQRVSELVALANQQQSAGQSNQMDTTLTGLFDSAAKKGGFYESLSDPEVRTKFKTYLIDLNPFVDQITDEFIDRQWLAYNKEAILEAAKIAAGGKPADDTRGKERGEGSGNRPGKPKASQEVRPWDDI